MPIQFIGNLINISSPKKNIIETICPDKLEESFPVLSKKRLEKTRIKNQINKKKTSRYLEDLTNKGD